MGGSKFFGFKIFEGSRNLKVIKLINLFEGLTILRVKILNSYFVESLGTGKEQVFTSGFSLNVLSRHISGTSETELKLFRRVFVYIFQFYFDIGNLE